MEGLGEYVANYCCMAFYESISAVYDRIFPLNPVQLEFITEDKEEGALKKVLDVGCGTGSLCIALSGSVNEIIGIDPDGKMLEIARSKAGNTHPNLQFLEMGMLEIGDHFREVSDLLCLGNTLVHLTSEQEVQFFLDQSREVLAPGGRLIIQIINYNRILGQQLRGLPTIENDHIRFERIYEYDRTSDRINFKTGLWIKETGQKIHNSIILIPLRKERLEEMLEKSGYRRIKFYGNFKREPLLAESIPLVVIAERDD